MPDPADEGELDRLRRENAELRCTVASREGTIAGLLLRLRGHELAEVPEWPGGTPPRLPHRAGHA